MNEIRKATGEQAPRLFEIMMRATEIGCGPCYPAEIIRIWHQGRSAEGMAEVIAQEDVHALWADGITRGFIHLADAEVVGLFVHPDDQGQGYGSALFRFGVAQIETRPVVVKATLNALPFYEKMGCRKIRTESVRRHDRDIYVMRMELI